MVASFDKVLPQNIEAEEAVLGGILLDPHAISRVAEWLRHDDFAITAHQTIYQAAIALDANKKPTDLMSVTSWLADRDLLDRIGGQMKLAQLVDRTVSAVNIDHYARLVQEKAVYRHLIKMGNDIIAQAYRDRDTTPLDLFTAAKHTVESLERTYQVTQSADSDELDFNLLDQQLEQIEKEENSAKRELKMRKLAKSWGMTRRDLLDFHAKWLDSKSSQIKSYTIDEYFELHGRSSEEWLIDGWIPKGKVILHSAFGGTGKTRVSGSQILAMVTGQKWGDYPAQKPRKVLIIQTDQGPTTTAKMLDIQGFLALAPEYKANLEIIDNWSIGEFGVLKRKLEQFKPDLVLIDSLTSVSSNSIYSENEVFYARPIVRMRHYASKYGCSFHILHHMSKSGQSRGTTAIYDSVDEVWIQSKSDQPTVGIISIEKSRTRAPGKYQIKFNESSWTWEPIYEVLPNGDLEAYGSTSDKIFRLLEQSNGTGLEIDEISEYLNLNSNTCRKEVAKLSREGRISSCRGYSGRLVYFYGTYPSRTRERSVDPERSATDQQTDQHSTPEPESVTDDKNRERSVDPQNSISDQCEEAIEVRINGSTDLSLAVQPSILEPESDTALIHQTDQPGSTDQPDQPPPPFPKVGDRVVRQLDEKRGIPLVVCKVVEVTTSSARTDANLEITPQSWNLGLWYPAPNPETDLPPVHSKILTKINYAWEPMTVCSLDKRKKSFTGQDKYFHKRLGLKEWRWPD